MKTKSNFGNENDPIFNGLDVTTLGLNLNSEKE